MNIKQIRNATLIIEYAGKKFLIDPVFADKGTYPPFPNSLRQDKNNPLVDLPRYYKGTNRCRCCNCYTYTFRSY